MLKKKWWRLRWRCSSGSHHSIVARDEECAYTGAKRKYKSNIVVLCKTSWTESSYQSELQMISCKSLFTESQYAENATFRHLDQAVRAAFSFLHNPFFTRSKLPPSLSLSIFCLSHQLVKVGELFSWLFLSYCEERLYLERLRFF